MDSLKVRPGFDGLAPVSHVDVSPCSHCSSFEHVQLDCSVMAIQRQFPFRPNHTTYPGLSQAGRSTYPNQGYSTFHNPTYAQQWSGQHTSYHQPYGSAPQHMGNPSPTSFAPGIQRSSKSRKQIFNKRLLRKSMELTKLYAAGAKVRTWKIKETRRRCSYTSD